MAPSWMVFLLFAGCSKALENTQASTVSQKCTEDTNTFLWEITQDRPKEYAVQMYDAFGKMGSNVKGGNANRPGLLQQCRSAHGPSFSAQYCEVFLKQGTVQYFVGICVPESCGEEDVEILVLSGSLQFGQTSLIPPLPHILVNQSTQEMIMTHCLSAIAPGALDAISLFVCCVMVAIPLAATLLTAIIKWQRNREVRPSAQTSCSNTGLNLYGTMKTNGSYSSDINHDTEENTPASHPEAFCTGAFRRSPYRNQPGSPEHLLIRPRRRLLLPERHPRSQLLWIIYNYKNWRTTVESNPLQVLTISGPVFLAVDTFLLLGIQPLHMFVMCLTIELISLIQWGPYWFPFIDTLMDCKTYWWANLFLISNLLPVHEICIPWSWYLSLDFQCYATTPVLVYFYRLNRGVFIVVAGGLLLMTTVAGAVVTALMHLPVFQPSTLTSEYYVLYYYVKPYTRYGPFLIGILAGIYLTTKKDPLLKHKWQAALGWIFCLSVMAAVIGLSYILKETPASPSVPHALYQGLHRPLWALAVTWIILACEDGYGGLIKNLLSLGFWVPLSNISFACYLTHPVFIILYIGLQETPIHYTDINFVSQHLFIEFHEATY
ncbi:hypothetical protein F7725_015691 [Dissostichus mawsoni]|uniref:Nose resistant-to-fluoxetine protein N-terminal domain-containing protein n=1 Tax=Dissostichus mawsoni TaxID=36200 RepID=A0A7J5YI99_DISMA|nr:hypothetical protein F7725_015691 [Dissostichus mawsoni]